MFPQLNQKYMTLHLLLKMEKMVMETDIDMNGYSINAPFFITGYNKKSKSSNRIFLNDVSTYQIIPFVCILNEIVCYFYTPNNNDYQITLNVRSGGKSNNNQTLSASVTENRPPSKRATKIKILDSSHCLCSDSSMCIDNKYHESLANSSFFVAKLGQVWIPVISDNYFA